MPFLVSLNFKYQIYYKRIDKKFKPFYIKITHIVLQFSLSYSSAVCACLVRKFCAYIIIVFELYVNNDKLLLKCAE